MIRTNQARQGGRQAEGILNRVSGAAERAQRRTSNLGRSVVQLAGAYAGLQGVRAAISTFATFERRMARVQGLTGATRAEFVELNEVAERVGRTTELSASQAADGLGFLAQAGFSVRESIQAMDAVTNLAIGTQIDFGRAADIASNVLTGFGLAATETARAVDVLGNTANSSNTNIEQLGLAMRFAAPAAAAVGVNIEEAAAAIGVLGNAGIQAGIAGRGLRAILSQLADAGFETSNGLLPILDELAQSNLDLVAANDLVGRQFGTSLVVLTNNRRELERLTQSNREAEGTMQRLVDIMSDTLLGSWRNLRSAIEATLIALGRSASDGIRGVLDSLTEGFRFLASNIQIVIDTLQALAAFVGTTIAFRTILAFLGGVATFFSGGLIGIMGSFVGLMGTLAGISIPAIAALTAFRETFNESSNTGLQRLGASLDAMVSVIETLVRSAIPDFRSFQQDFDLLLERFATGLSDLIDTLFGALDRLIEIGRFLNLRPFGADVQQSLRGIQNPVNLPASAAQLSAETGVFPDEFGDQIQGLTSSIERNIEAGRRLSEAIDRQREIGGDITSLDEQLAEINETLAADIALRERYINANEAIAAAGGLTPSLIEPSNLQGDFRAARTEAERQAALRRAAIADTGVSGPEVPIFDVAQQADSGTGTGGGGGTQEEISAVAELRAELTRLYDQETELIELTERERGIREELLDIENQFREAGAENAAQEAANFEGTIRGLTARREELEETARVARQAGSIINSAFGQFFDTTIDSFFELSNNADEAFEAILDAGKQLVQDLIAEFIKLAASQVFRAILAAATGGTSEASGAGSFLSGLFGAQRGASFVVGGYGGIDNNLALIPGVQPFRVSRGERIDVVPRGETNRGGNTTSYSVNIAIDTINGDGDPEIIASQAAAIVTDNLPNLVQNVNAVNRTDRPFR